MAETMARTMPVILAYTGLQTPKNIQSSTGINNDLHAEPSPFTLRSERFYCEESSTNISEDPLELSKKAFSTVLSIETWNEFAQAYPTIKDTESLPIAPNWEAGMKHFVDIMAT